MSRCKFSNPKKKKICMKKPWSKSDKYCIFHDPNPNKPADKFKKLMKKQLEGEGKNHSNLYIGYHFPLYFTDFYSNSEFNHDLSLNDSVFEGNIHFENIVFEKHVYFNEVTFKKPVMFKDVTFKSNVEFTNAVINYGYFKNVRFEGQAIFEKSDLNNIDMKNCKFNKGVYFQNGKFNGNTVLENCTFKDKAWFYNANFGKDLKILDIEFNSEAKFEGSEFKEIIEIDKTHFNKPEDGEYLYRNAISTWEEKNDRAKADLYFVKMMREKRRQKGKFKSILEWMLVDITTEYGTSWLNILFSWAIIILGSAFIYGVFNGLDSEINCWQSLYFSIITFATLGYGDISPANDFTRIVASIESLLGAILISAFVVVFTRTYMR